MKSVSLEQLCWKGSRGIRLTMWARDSDRNPEILWDIAHLLTVKARLWQPKQTRAPKGLGTNEDPAVPVLTDTC